MCDCVYYRIDGNSNPFCEIYTDERPPDCDTCEEYVKEVTDLEQFKQNLDVKQVGQISFGDYGTIRLPIILVETPTATYAISACSFLDFLHRFSASAFDADGKRIPPMDGGKGEPRNLLRGGGKRP